MFYNDVYLNLIVRKSLGKTDEHGNFIFEVEASNENLDLENQVILQRALLDSKDEFLRSGVISCDHLHRVRKADGSTEVNNGMVIGEPIDVKTDGKSTIVVGKLYKTNEKAKEFIDLLKAGSTRVRASVGGILPKIMKDAKTGVEQVVQVLWNDLALTVSPVNNTVSSAIFAKSMNSDEFVKALSAGYGTDSASMEGGRSLIPENIGSKTQDYEDSEIKEATRSLIAALQTGEVKSEKEAESFLMDLGVNNEDSRFIIREIITQGGQMMKKSFSNLVAALLKSLAGGNQNEDDANLGEGENLEGQIAKSQSDETGNDSFFSNKGDEANKTAKSNDGKGESPKDKDDKDDKDKENEDEGELVDGTELIKSLSDNLESLTKSFEELKAQQQDNGEAVHLLAQMVHKIGSEQMPPRSVLNKSMSAGVSTSNNINNEVPTGRPTQADFIAVQDVLIKSVQANEIDLIKSSQISSDFQNCMQTGRPMKKENYEFLNRKLGGK